ncbi:MAG: cell division protein [Candidatus Thiodiazotropha sp. (ex Epidulcina cf. delphinae)]|nr:cell division protein [Candidatus Thiodiazotropha sp. (ex Epidulcina cf. delphinae)]
MLPERPPWRPVQNRQAFRPGMEERMQHRQRMMSMTDEERDAYRRERYLEMREQAQEMGVEMPETPPWAARRQALDEEWAKHREVIEGMSDEERAACHAMHRRHMGMMPGRGMGHHRGCGMMGQGGCSMGPAVPGYGYGPGPYAPWNFRNPNR